MDNINQLLTEVQTISESFDRVAEATGENFNIFSILQMESNEVTTHSRFIAELLNPKGRHGQNDLFLKRFLERFGINDLNTEKASVIVEYYIGKVTENYDSGGRIDILIKAGERVVMIENKIYADLQPNQLERYKKAFPNGTLLYLNLFNQFETNTDEKLETIYQAISYESDIINWLEECKKESVNAPILRETIGQYIHLIKKLTNQNLNSEMNRAIVDRVLRDEKSFNSFKSLLNTKNEIFEHILTQSFFPLLEKIALNQALEIGIDNNTNNISLVKKELLNHSTKWKRFHFTNDKLKKLNLGIGFSFNVPKGYNRLIYGFVYLNPKEKVDHSALKTEFDTKFDVNAFTTQSWPCAVGFEKYSNWDNMENWFELQSDNFEIEFTQKVTNMLHIINNVYKD